MITSIKDIDKFNIHESIINKNINFDINKNKLKDYELSRYLMILNTIQTVGNSLYTKKQLNQSNYNLIKQYLEYPYNKSIYKKIIRYYTRNDKLKTLNINDIYNYIYKLVIIYKSIIKKKLYVKINKNQLDDFLLQGIFIYTLYILLLKINKDNK